MNGIRNAIDKVYDLLSANLNAYIESTQQNGESWFTPLSFTKGSPRNEDSFLMGIYLSSPDASVFEGTSGGGVVKVALDCVLDKDVDDSNLPQLYLGAVIDYLTLKASKLMSVTTLAQIARVDLDAEVNAFSVLVEVSVYTDDLLL